MARKKRPKKKSAAALKREKQKQAELEAAKNAASEEKASKEDEKEPDEGIGFADAQDMLESGEVKHYSRDLCFHTTLQNPAGGDFLLNKAMIQLTHGHRYGLIGNNGCGKSTLLSKLSSGEIPEIPKYLRILHVKQEMEGKDRTVIETVMRSDAEMDHLLSEKKRLHALQYGDAQEGAEEHKDYSGRIGEIEERLKFIEADQAESRASMVLDGLKFTDKMKNMKTADLSGGWRMRVSLACALYCEPDILLLDEPTNHLDFPSVLWLTDYLATYPEDKILLVVSHDQEFLNEVTTDIINVEKQELVYYKGNFAQFCETRDAARKTQAVQFKRQQTMIEHNKDYIRRFKANKKLSSMAQSRQKMLDKLERDGKVIKAVDFERFVKFRFPDPAPLRNPLIVKAEEASFSYFKGWENDANTVLLKNLNLRIDMGDVVGILGSNGCGKSTLLKLIMGELNASRGAIHMPNSVSTGYFSQHHMDTLRLDMTPIQFLRSTFPSATIQDCYGQLGRFNFSHTCAKKKISCLSGGEKSRIAFAILTWYSPHVIIMDEPTNHLDYGTIEALIDALQAYTGQGSEEMTHEKSKRKGSVLIVSHDQHFLKSVCTEYWSIGNRTVNKFNSFVKARDFSYKHSKPVDCLPREFSTVETKKGVMSAARVSKDQAHAMPTVTSVKTTINEDGEMVVVGDKKARKVAAAKTEIFIDCEREIAKGINKGTSPSKMLRSIRGWEPNSKDNSHINKLAFYMLGKFFDKSNELDAPEFFGEFQALLKYLVPDGHIANQKALLDSTEACWFTAKKDGEPRAKKKDSLLDLLKLYEKLNIVELNSLVAYRSDDLRTKTNTGGVDAMKQCNKWLAGLKGEEMKEVQLGEGNTAGGNGRAEHTEKTRDDTDSGSETPPTQTPPTQKRPAPTPQIPFHRLDPRRHRREGD